MAWNILWNIFALFFAAPQDYPDHVGVVNDFANEIDAKTKGKIEAVIADAQKKADVRIVLVVVTSLGGKTPADYAVGLGNKWGVGQKGKNNGILFLHAPKERKIWIANGYGVESRLTDIESKMIIDQTIIPLMKEKKFAEAMLRGTEEIAKVVSAPEKQPEKQEAVPVAANTDSGGIGGTGIFLIVVLFAVMLVIFFVVISNTGPAYPARMVTPRHYSPPAPVKREDDFLGIDPLTTGMLAATLLGASAPPVQNQAPIPPLPPLPPMPEPSIADAFLAEQRRRDEEDRRRRRRREEEEEEERRRRRRRDDDSSYGGGSSSSSSWSSSDSSSSSSFDGGSFGGGGAGGDY